MLSDEKRAAQVAQAVGVVQKGRDSLDRAQEQLVRAMGLPSKSDYKALAVRISSLKRRARHLAEKLEKGRG